MPPPHTQGKSLYQDFTDLFRLRDCLVHLKPDDLIESQENDDWTYTPRAFIDKLRSKNILSDFDFTEVKSLTLLVGTAKPAKWACDVASKMVMKILDRIPKSEFSRNNQALDWYRSMFQPLNANEDTQQVSSQDHTNRQASVSKVHELREKLQEKYGQFPDSTELILEDRDRWNEESGSW